MKNILMKIRTRKILILLLTIIILSFISGVLFTAVISDTNKQLVFKTLDNFFLQISKDQLNYLNAFVSSLSENLIIMVLIWILGISIIGIFITFIFLAIKSFILGFSLSSIIMYYGLSGVFISLIYSIPLIVNLFLYLVLSYYSVNFSLMLFNYLFRKKEYNRKIIVRRYLKILFFMVILFIFSSCLETFLVPYILKIFIHI